MKRRVRRRLLVAGVGLAAVVAVGGAVVAVSALSAPPPTASEQVAEYLKTHATVAPLTSAPLPVIAIVGDSFASTAPDDWGPRTARCAGYQSVISGVRSSGFYNPGIGVNYGHPDRMKAVTKDIPDVVIFETAYNDARRAETKPEWIQKSAIDAIEAYRKVAPRAKFVIFGPFPTDRFDGPNVTNNIAALKAAATATGAVHIIPTLAWQPTTEYTDADLAHPSDKGHRYLASKLLVALRDAHVITSTGGCEKLPG